MNLKCSHCRTEIPGQLSFCPVCGTINDFQKSAPSFENTWASISEETLKKKPSKKAFDETWDWYVKDLRSHPEDTLQVCSFLEKYPDQQPSFDSLSVDLEPFENLIDAMDPVYRVLLYGVSRMDGASFYTFLKQNPGLAGRLRMVLEEKEEIPNQLRPFLLALQGEKTEARKALKELLGKPDDSLIALNDPFSIELFTSLHNSAKERQNDLALARTQDRLDDYLEGLYRPMAGEKNPFEHLESVGFRLEQFLKAHAQEWVLKTVDLLESDQALRGIHLAAQTIKNACPSLQEECETILSKQYEKAYMRPYSEIEQTDYCWE